jgi:predicted small lipoprotein YifL|nr:MAG TPA_asm: protein of unknown function (DUF4969) [Caudoviricetes sp.]
MKKIIATIISLIVLISLTACGSEGGATVKQVDPTKFPEAEHFEEFAWPEFGISEKLPKPDWSNRGEVEWDMDTYFSVNIGYSTKADFDSYVKECYDAGFTVNYYNNETIIGDMYTASNEEGYMISVVYRAKNIMSIQLTAPDVDEQ